MDAERLAALKHRLLVARPTDISTALRGAVEEIALEGTPSARSVLLEVLGSNGDKELSRLVLQVLGDLASRGMVEPIYELWWASQDPRLTALLAEEGWITEFSSHVRVIRELEAGLVDNLAQGGADVVAPLIKAALDTPMRMQELALRCLSSLQTADAVDALCGSWAENRRSSKPSTSNLASCRS